MASELKFDELNRLYDELKTTITSAYNNGQKGSIKEYVEDMLIVAFKEGRREANQDLDEWLEDEEDFDSSLLLEALNKEYDGKTYKDRLDEYLNGGTVGQIVRVAETEFHRMSNEGMMSAAKQISDMTGIGITKTWVTMLDDRVRDTHEPLESITVDLADYFVTYDGSDKALEPGGFEKESNNINCRCLLKFGFKG